MTMEEVSSEIAVMKSILQRLEYRLLGNGQPGELEKQHIRIEQLDNRIVDLDKSRSYYSGALWIIGIILTLAVSGGLLHVFKVGVR